MLLNENLIVVQGTLSLRCTSNINIVFKTAWHWILSSTKRNKSTTSHVFFLKIHFNIVLPKSLQIGTLHANSPTKIFLSTNSC